MAHSNVKLPEAAVQEMIRLRREGRWSQAKIAHEFKCSKATVQKYLAPYEAEAATHGPGADPAPAAPEPVPMRLDQIRLDGEGLGTSARTTIIPHVIAEYAEAMSEGVTFPPVILFQDAEGYWIGDGHHRCRAAKQVGYETIAAEVRAGGYRDAMLYACGANATHGLPRTALEKRSAVEVLLEDEVWRKWSDNHIAKHCGVSPTTVGSIRASLSNLDSDDGQRTYTTKHGTQATMDTSRIGTRAEPTTPVNGGPDEVQEVIAHYPALGDLDAPPRQVIALGKVLDRLPAGEAVTLLEMLQVMGLPWFKLAEAIPRVAGMSAATRQNIYRLWQADRQRERSRALTLVSGSGASPDPQLGHLDEVRGLLKQAVHHVTACTQEYDHDPWAPDLQAIITELRGIDAKLSGIGDRMQEATRRAYDAALSEPEREDAGDA